MKKIYVLLTMVALLMTMVSCGGKPVKSENNVSSNKDTASGISVEMAMQTLNKTGNTVAAPSEKLPAVKKDGDAYSVTVDGFKSIEFKLPKTIEEAFEQIGNSEELNDMYLKEIPDFSCDFPEELTDTVLADYQECQPSLSSINVEKAYQNADGTVQISYGKSMLGVKQYVYRVYDADKNELAAVYYDGETRAISAVQEYLYDYEKDPYKDGGRKFKLIRSFSYNNGIVEKIAIEAENTDYQKDGEYDFWSGHKVSFSYLVKDNRIAAMKDGYFYFTYNVDQAEGNNYNHIGLYPYFDQNGKLEAIRTTADRNDYYYLIDDNVWFSAEGDRVEEK